MDLWQHLAVSSLSTTRKSAKAYTEHWHAPVRLLSLKNKSCSQKFVEIWRELGWNGWAHYTPWGAACLEAFESVCQWVGREFNSGSETCNITHINGNRLCPNQLIRGCVLGMQPMHVLSTNFTHSLVCTLHFQIQRSRSIMLVFKVHSAPQYICTSVCRDSPFIFFSSSVVSKKILVCCNNACRPSEENISSPGKMY